ncbi:MAG: A/G-specific adenine glycosylase [Pseudomonadota bacterium]|nr:A/G-specific adenine glycosylase [Pseudomonadota bacterium]
MNFAERVIEWQQAHGRHDLPWQRTRDPYRIWLSEVMLQQTQVATVTAYYQRFVECFDDVQALAMAPLESVMERWAGLGYYSRARNLHRCAQHIVDHHGGEFPRSVDALARLPGIGRTTAAAIAALAFGQRAAILDGNVKRVLARYMGVEGFPGNPAVERTLWQHADALLPAVGIAAYTQGLMDLGATVCTRTRPMCDECPVNRTCIARREHAVDRLPAPRPVRSKPVRAAIVLVLRDESDAVLLEPRPPAGIWGGLLSLPEFDAEATREAVAAQTRARYGLHIAINEVLREVRHEFTHYTYLMRPYVARVICASAIGDSSLRRITEHEFQSAALPTPIRRLLMQLANSSLPLLA